MRGKRDFYIDLLYSAKNIFFTLGLFLRSLGGLHRGSFLYSWCRSLDRCVLSNNLDGHLHLYVLMEVDNGLVVANLLDVVHRDDLAINFNALLCKFVGHDCSIDRAIEMAGGSHLGDNLQSHAGQSFTLLFCFSL